MTKMLWMELWNDQDIKIANIEKGLTGLTIMDEMEDSSSIVRLCNDTLWRFSPPFLWVQKILTWIFFSTCPCLPFEQGIWQIFCTHNVIANDQFPA